MGKHSKHAKGDGVPRRHAKLSGWVLGAGLTLLALSCASGAMVWWGQTASALDAAGDEGPLVSGNWRRLHGALNPFVWGMLGYLIHQHIRIGWRNRACLVSGFLMLGVVAGMAVTGTYLVYGGNEISRAAVVGVHKLLALTIPIVLAAHWMEAIFWVKRIEQSIDVRPDVER